MAEEMKLCFQLMQGQLWLERIEGNKGVGMQEIDMDTIIWIVKHGLQTLGIGSWKMEW